MSEATEEKERDLHRIALALNAYAAIGSGFDELVEEYGKLKAEMDNKRWALQEFQRTNWLGAWNAHLPLGVRAAWMSTWVDIGMHERKDFHACCYMLFKLWASVMQNCGFVVRWNKILWRKNCFSSFHWLVLEQMWICKSL